MRSKAGPVALGGMLTAVAVVIMCMGSLIPLNTYICPVLCILVTRPLLSLCGKRFAGCYYAAVSILSLLLAPDREAAMIYVCLGYYPLIKPMLDKIRPAGLALVLKMLLFALAGAVAYWLMANVMGMGNLSGEFQQAGTAMTIVMVVLFMALFVMVDRLLGMPLRTKNRKS